MFTKWERIVGQRLVDVARGAGLQADAEIATLEISGVTDDSRAVEPGDLFVAHRGASADGHAFVPEALARGAVAVVSEEDVAVDVPHWRVPDGRAALARLAAAFYDHPTRHLLTVAVTGTNGKTSVCHFAAHLLGRDRTTLISTVENVQRGLQSLTTPSSPIVQRIAADSVRDGREAIVIEASSIGLAQHRLDEVDVDIAAFTNLTRDHLDLHGTMEAYGQAKLGLFRSLKPEGTAVLWADDPFSRTIESVCRGDRLSYSLAGPADLTARPLGRRQEGEEAVTLALAFRGQRTQALIPSLEGHALTNVAAAVAIAVAAGRRLDDLVEPLATLPEVPGRWQRFRHPAGIDAVIDYAHTPDALERILKGVRRGHARVLVVFGCAGGSDRGKRPQMGRLAARLADLAVLTTDNPKEESPDAILDEIAAGVPRGAGIRIVDREEAIAHAVSQARPGDVVLVAGKGHEAYQIVRGTFVPYSDARVLADLGFRPLGAPLQEEKGRSR